MTKESKQLKSMRFQNLSRQEYFEGWYFKQVTQDETTVVCFIPGVSVKEGKSSPFIQAILARRALGQWQQKSDWLDYAQLNSQDDPFLITLGENSFRRGGIRIDYQGKALQVSGSLDFGELSHLPSSLYAPTIMGPFSYLPAMECIHSVISLHHSIQGFLRINGEEVDFTGGRGYIEKDWGSSFPKRYVWLQSNHFSSEGSLFFSWADIPVLGTVFHGYIAHLFYRGEHHRYATYTRGSCRIKAKEDGIDVVLTNKESQLHIKARQTMGALLLAPHRGEMVHTIKEGLFGELSFCLKKKGQEVEICDRTSLAGVEIVFEKGKTGK